MMRKDWKYRCLAGALLALGAAGAAGHEAFEGRDPSVAPGADFFAYANGGWAREVQIPADRSTYGTFAMMQEVADQRTVDLIREAAASDAPAGTDRRRVGDYFAAFMDEDAIEQRGIAPLAPLLDAVAAIGDRRALARVLGGTLRADVDVMNATNIYTPNLFGLWVAQDMDSPARYVPFLLQGGLGMPDREYYLKDDARMADLRAKYQEHITAVLTLAGQADAAQQAARILALEVRIAQVHASRVDSHDVKKGDNHWTRAQFDTLAPGMDWSAFFEAAGLGAQQDFIAWQPQAITGIAALVGSEPVATWKEYLRFHTIDRLSGTLPRAYVQEQFHFYENVLSGTPQMRERWKRGVAATNGALGEAVGHLYVDRHFPPQSKALAEQMVHNIIAAFDQRIDRLAWMTPETRRVAKEKLATLKVGVGYPNRWRDYSALEVVRGDALGNRLRAERFELRRNLAKLGQPIDREEWVMNPQLVNAVNLPVMNAIQFPAAILQEPTFSASNTIPANYGGVGGVIGHEISHSFDNEGALFDPSGRLRNWWTPQDFEHFEASGKALAQQYDAYHPFPDLAVRGQQTLGENIADLAGLAAAYDAYRAAVAGQPVAKVAGLDGDQQFFLSYGQFWRAKLREPAARQRILTDVHAPPQYRAATVRNIDAWYAAFGVKPGDALYLAPADRVRVW